MPIPHNEVPKPPTFYRSRLIDGTSSVEPIAQTFPDDYHAEAIAGHQSEIDQRQQRLLSELRHTPDGVNEERVVRFCQALGMYACPYIIVDDATAPEVQEVLERVGEEQMQEQLTLGAQGVYSSTSGSIVINRDAFDHVPKTDRDRAIEDVLVHELSHGNKASILNVVTPPKSAPSWLPPLVTKHRLWNSFPEETYAALLQANYREWAGMTDKDAGLQSDPNVLVPGKYLRRDTDNNYRFLSGYAVATLILESLIHQEPTLLNTFATARCDPSKIGDILALINNATEPGVGEALWKINWTPDDWRDGGNSFGSLWRHLLKSVNMTPQTLFDSTAVKDWTAAKIQAYEARTGIRVATGKVALKNTPIIQGLFKDILPRE